MRENPGTIAQLRRRIVMLEAKLAKANQEIGRHLAVYQDNLYTTVDQQTRIIQAIKILEGNEL